MNERGALKLALPPGWQPLRGWVLLLAVMFVLNAATYVVLTRPLWFGVTAQSRALEAARQARLLLEPALEEARTNYGLVLQAEADLEDLRTRVAASATSLSGVIGSLEERLRAVGMQFERGNYAQERIDELDMVALQMAVPLSGRYSAVRQLVELLAAGDEFMAIDQVGLMTPDQAGTGGSLRVELQLVAFLPGTHEATALESGDGALPEAATGEVAADMPPEEARPEIVEPTSQPESRPVSNISPVQRAGELQARLASLPPLPYPPEAYDVRLGDLDASKQVSAASARNLFDFVRQAPPPVQPRPQPEDRPGGAGGRRRGQGEGQPSASSSLPAIPLRLLGIVRVGSTRYASLTDGTELHVAAEGSSLPGGYQVVEVGIDYAEIKSGEQQVRLTLES